MALLGITATWAIEDTAQLPGRRDDLDPRWRGWGRGFAIIGEIPRCHRDHHAANADYARGLGADRVVDYNAENFARVVFDCDVVVDGEVQARWYSVLKPDGRLSGSPRLRLDVTVLCPVVCRDRAALGADRGVASRWRGLTATHRAIRSR
jgi:hypothetical protein